MNRAVRTALAFAALASLVVGGNVVGQRAGRSQQPLAGASHEATPRSSSGSVYDLGLRVRDADGVVRGLDDLRGHPVLATMFYASCPTVCPLLINDLKGLAAAATSEVGDDLRILLVSFDPARDAPAALLDVARRHGLDPRQWRIAVAPDEGTARALAAVLGIRYRATAWGMIDHTTIITVLDRQGGVRGRAEAPLAAGALLAGLANHKPTAAR